MRLSRLALGTAAATLAMTTLVACGGDDDDAKGSAKTLEGLSGEEVREASVEAMNKLQSMRIVGELGDETAQMSLDLALDTSGRCTGTWGAGDGTAEVRSDGEFVYLDGDEVFWSVTSGSEAAGAQTLAQLDGKWARMPAEQMGGFCSLDDLLEGINKNSGATVELGEVIDHDGRKALEVTTTNAEGEKSFGLVAWENEHHLLQVRREPGTEGGSFDLSEFNEPVEVELPAEGEFLDVGGD